MTARSARRAGVGSALLPLLYLAAFAGLELGLAWGGGFLPLVLAYLVLMALLIVQGVYDRSARRDLYAALALLPAARLFVLTLPAAAFAPGTLAPLIGLGFLIAALLGRRALGLSRAEFGAAIRPLRGVSGALPNVGLWLLGLIVQLAIAAAGWTLLAAPPAWAEALRASAPALPLGPIGLLALGVTLLVVGEEAMFRGVVQAAAVRSYGFAGILVPAIASGALLLPWLPPTSLALVAGLGLAASLIRWITGSWLGAAGARALGLVVLLAGPEAVRAAVASLPELFARF